jgi:hypothetical protein
MMNEASWAVEHSAAHLQKVGGGAQPQIGIWRADRLKFAATEKSKVRPRLDSWCHTQTISHFILKPIELSAGKVCS